VKEFNRNYKSHQLREILPFLWNRIGPRRAAFTIGLILSLSQAVTMILDPYFVSLIINKLELGEYHKIPYLLVVMIVVFIATSAFVLIAEYLKLTSVYGLNADLMVDLADQAQKMPYEQAQLTHSSDLVQRITHDTPRLTRILSLMLDNMADQVLMFTLASIYMIWINWKIAFCVLVISPIMLLASHMLSNRLQRIGHDIAVQESVVRQYQQDALQGLEVIRAYGISDWMRDRFVKERTRLNALYTRRAWMYQQVTLLTNTLSHLMVIATVLIMGYLAINNSMPLGTLTLYFTLIWRINSPLQAIGGFWGQIQESLGSSRRVFALLNVESEPSNKEAQITRKMGKSDILVRNVRFEYLEQSGLEEERVEIEELKTIERIGIRSFDMHIPTGKFVAIIGPSGSGKSTIAKLSSGLLFASEGEIRIGGLDPLIDAESARSLVAYVPQVPVLFTGTIRENLAIANPDAEENELIDAARRAQAHEFILTLSKGYDTVIQELGNSLSGGQKQRLAIARALLSDRPILIMDETTSALDIDTEREVMKAVLQLTIGKGRTLLVIAHRLSTIKDADHIIVMDKGSIQQQGKHVDLWEDNEALYRQLWGQMTNEMESEGMRQQISGSRITDLK
jgi:ABC-type multidrug transport system fused ATPase/permease subunit